PGIQEVGEALRRQDLLLQRDLADRLAGPMRLLGDLGRRFVPDFRRECRAHGQALLDPGPAPLGVGFEALHTANGEVFRPAGQQRGPEPSHRMSLAIFIRLTATVRSAPLASTSASWAAWASKWFFASCNGQRVSRASNTITRLANSGWAFKPVPTAVPPKASSP